MIVAVMDLGTNTFHLVIARFDKKGSEILYKNKAAVKIGENGITSNLISPVPFRRGVITMKKFRAVIDRHKPQRIVALGTAAIRKAENMNDFLKAIHKETGIKVQVIDGMTEAGLIYQGVKQAMDMGTDKSIIMDIGGGSVEFIIADSNKIYWKHSFELGAALLLEKFNPADPVTSNQLKKINAYMDKELQPLFAAAGKYKPANLIGSSGSFDTFAEMIACRFYKRSLLKNKTSYLFKMEEYRAIHQQLIYSTTAERKKMKGLIPMRVDMIVIASIILTFVLEKLDISTMYLSSYALKEGALWKLMHHKKI